MKKNGAYDELIDSDLEVRIQNFHTVTTQKVGGDLLDTYIQQTLNLSFQQALAETIGDENKLKLASTILRSMGSGKSLTSAKVLKGLVLNSTDEDLVSDNPLEIPLGDLALLTNAKGEPSIGPELRAELHTVNRVDILMAFVKVSGLRIFYDQLLELRKRNVEVRLITSTYMGATDKKALDQLVTDLGVKVKIDYLARTTRLHAKAWLLERDSGFSTAYVGSSNISDPAMGPGLEWNVRLSQTRSPHLLQKFRIAFEGYWQGANFEDYDPITDGAKLEEALQKASGTLDGNSSLTLSGLDVVPFSYQVEMLEALEYQREYHDVHKNLIVAATGTGKTVLAALDFRNFFEREKRLPSILFVAHRVEILEQSRRKFAEVLKMSEFGELLVSGSKPKLWNHVFASIKSLTPEILEKLDANKFDYICIDEFHHAAAKTYRGVLNHFQPKELVGLTATPERTDGTRVQDLFFNGVIAAELRLWDALDRELLTPFHYFGIGEETDFTKVAMSGGKYVVSELSKVVTGNDIRDRLMLRELMRKVPNLQTMSAIFFCVDVSHATHIAWLLNKQGISAKLVTGQTASAERKKIVRDFTASHIRVIVSVDVFNEGLDVPQIDTVVMLRPTESPVLFLQQLGRGLRKYPGKSEVLVLDFIGAHNSKYRADIKLAAITGRNRGNLNEDLEKGFPYLPTGVVISLDELASKNVLANLKAQVAPGKSALAKEVKSSGAESISEYLAKSSREIWEIYKGNSLGWFDLLNFEDVDAEFAASPLAGKLKTFLHLNDRLRFEAYRRFATGKISRWSEASESEKRLRSMFFWHLWPSGSCTITGKPWSSIDQAIQSLSEHEAFGEELGQVIDYLDANCRNITAEIEFKKCQLPLLAHANYSRHELLGAIARGYLPGSEFEIPITRSKMRNITLANEGVHRIDELDLDLLVSTLNKSESYSPTTRYRDYAESATVFHWESQNSTSPESEVGKRYLNQPETKSDVLLAVREYSQGEVVASSFRLIGLADLIKHEGSKPIKIWWKLRIPLDDSTYKAAAAVRVA